MIKSPRAVAVAAAALSLAVPAAAQAARGTVLSVDRSHHVLRALTAPAKVRALHWRGRLPAGVRPGTRIAYTLRGRRGAKLRVLGRLSRLDVPGTVEPTPTGGSTVTLPDGSPLPIGNLNVSLANVPAGTKVLVHVTFSNGAVDVTIEVVGPPPAAQGDSSDESEDPGWQDDESPGDGQDAPSCEQDAFLVRIAGVNRRSGVVATRTPDGEEQTYDAGASILGAIAEGDVAVVRIAGDAIGSVSVLESDAGSPVDPAEKVADGTVVRINGDAQQTTLKLRDGSRLTLDLPCWGADELWTAEDVHVTYQADDSGDLVLDAVIPNDGSDL